MSTDVSSNLDQIDLDLIQQFETDATQTHKSLADKLQISRHTVRNRLRRLLEMGVINPICYVDPLSLGYKYDVALGISAQPGEIENVANVLASFSFAPHVVLSMGRLNILAGVMFRDRDQLLDFLTKGIGTVTGVERLEMALKVQAVKTNPGILTNHTFVPNLSVDLDPTDISLVRMLQRNPTQKTKQLARGLGTSESTILRRMQRLRDQRVINISGATNAFMLGYEGIATFWITAESNMVNEVANAVAAYPDIQYVGIYTGPCDIIAMVNFRDLSRLRQFISNELGKTPGLRSLETMPSLKIVKYLYRYLES